MTDRIHIQYYGIRMLRYALKPFSVLGSTCASVAGAFDGAVHRSHSPAPRDIVDIASAQTHSQTLAG